MSEIDYGIQEIQYWIPHRHPFLLVDKILEIVPNERIVGIKNVTMTEPCFQGHFPDYPILPGVLIVEAMACGARRHYPDGASRAQEARHDLQDEG